ncbi:MAG: hypothetical protein UU34_C0009G0018 [Candidatus Curtissbacteria bacterium GW2011_GWA1_41_11]|uniref:Uncharacterized protein n=1 Tax=Candidatus Curtissbacteria bacterium GW2011_GWA1_41_11 TaxID=1618409 RepID=A0A0G0WQU6_9BACT|nr:MAG: hypothetical protein UU34_C0009G0018 [Candidatus Curtissbacteria bacterium GW2011_GWA1_41_11]
MDPQKKLPIRSRFWFKKHVEPPKNGKIFDQITIVYSIVLAVLSFAIFWPIISKIEFEEAFFTPLVPFLINLLSAYGIGASEAVRGIFIISSIAATVGLYLFIRDLTKRQIVPILSALVFLIPHVPVGVLTFLKNDLSELISTRSFFTIAYGDGAQILALAILPFAAISFVRYLREPKNIYLILSVILSSLVLLINRSQAVNLFLVLGVLSLTEFFLELNKDKFVGFFRVVFLSLGLVAFWYTPSFWVESYQLVATQIIENIKFLFPLPFIIITLSLVFSFIFFARRYERQPIFIAFLLFIIFLSIILSWFLSGYSFIPHPHRLVPNLIMFGAIVAALILTSIIDSLRIVEKLNFEYLKIQLKIAGAVVFGVTSFVVLVAVAYSIFPYAVSLISGPSGFWTKVRESVVADRNGRITLADGNFKLVQLNVGVWQQYLGSGLSLLFLIYLVTLYVNRRETVVRFMNSVDEIKTT